MQRQLRLQRIQNYLVVMYYRRFQHRFQQGFSFIEVMIGVLIVSIAAYGMVVGATHCLLYTSDAADE